MYCVCVYVVCMCFKFQESHALEIIQLVSFRVWLTLLRLLSIVWKRCDFITALGLGPVSPRSRVHSTTVPKCTESEDPAEGSAHYVSLANLSRLQEKSAIICFKVNDKLGWCRVCEFSSSSCDPKNKNKNVQLLISSRSMLVVSPTSSLPMSEYRHWCLDAFSYCPTWYTTGYVMPRGDNLCTLVAQCCWSTTIGVEYQFDLWMLVNRLNDNTRGPQFQHRCGGDAGINNNNSRSSACYDNKHCGEMSPITSNSLTWR